MSRTIDIRSLATTGAYATLPAEQADTHSLSGLFICRLPGTGSIERTHAVPFPDSTDVVLAFSRNCTHLGCNLLRDAPLDHPGMLAEPQGVVRCPCHWSAFDLRRLGLAITGPATDALPQVSLRATGNPHEAELLGWVQERAIPYGVPFGVVSKAAPPAPPPNTSPL
jgi:Rieske Fe-S protein